MKKIILSLATLLIVVNVFSQTRPTPKVKKAFSEKYENAEIVRWESETEKNRVTIWKAFFTHDDVLSVAWFDPKGNWVQTKTEMDNGQEGFDVQFSEQGDVLNRTIRSKGYKPIDSKGEEKE